MTQTIARQAAGILLQTESVLLNAREPFQYTSGHIGPVYVDCRRPLSFPQERTKLMDLAVQSLKEAETDKPFDLIAGAETAGIPYGALLSERLGKPFIYVRKKPKGHGRMSQIEGTFDQDSAPRTLLVEDLQNYGSSKNIFVKALREAGATLEHFFVLFDYGIREEVKKENAEMGLAQHHLCNWMDIVDVAREQSLFDTMTLDSVEEYLANPEGWEQKAREKA
jgi:orotate phosphoribosyltransferase